MVCIFLKRASRQHLLSWLAYLKNGVYNKDLELKFKNSKLIGIVTDEVKITVINKQ